MNLRHTLCLVVTATVLTTACERKTVVVVETPTPEPVAATKTLETARLGAAIDAYEKSPTPENAADVQAAFAKLDSEIAELQGYIAKHEGSERDVAVIKHANLTKYRSAETARFMKAQAEAHVAPVRDVDGRSGADKVEDSARKAGATIEDAAKKTGSAVREGAEKIGDAIKDAVK